MKLLFLFSFLSLSLLIAVARFVFHENLPLLRAADGFGHIFIPKKSRFRRAEPGTNPAAKYVREKTLPPLIRPRIRAHPINGFCRAAKALAAEYMALLLVGLCRRHSFSYKVGA